MAMRPRYRIGNQPRQLIRQTYESFQPKSEWKYEDDATILHVYLPGFVKEQLKLMYTNVDNITLSVKVEGQRPLGGGRWSRFSEFYKIPETCDIYKINSQFQHGVLSIIMPKIKFFEPKREQGSKPEATQETSSSQEVLAGSSTLLERQKEEKEKSVEAPSPSEEKSQKGQDETSQKALSPKKVTTTSDQEKSQKGEDETSQKTAPLIDTARKGPGGESAYEKVDEKSQMGASPKTAAEQIEAKQGSKSEATQETSSPDKEVLAETSALLEKQREEKGKYVEALSPKKVTTISEEKSQKGEDETSQKTVPLIDKERVGSGGESAYEKVDEKSQMGHQVHEAAPKTAALIDMTEQNDHEKKSVAESDGQSSYRKADEKEKLEKPEGEQKIDRSKEDDLITEKSKDTKHESASASEGLTEGKQLLLNMGTAALVIMGIGAYLSYTFHSFGKS